MLNTEIKVNLTGNLIKNMKYYIKYNIIYFT